ncbi:uncharacterized protein LOC110689758 [Chenopodium quinoa]|uniref:uncharacterized protein LOC110689758 n=1 Tax=Chenopodium quinoa TaxID=63459 RepID=UPI000B788945|nr:uncharacterized protein LOC110689758 [Chenopodium quinoa]
MSAILYMRHKPEDYLAHWYNAATYEKTYDNLLQPVPGSTFWNQEGEGLVLPPDIINKGPGKKKTTRRKDADEPSKGKVKYNRSRMPNKCSNCRQPGHYKNKCPHPSQSQKENTSSAGAKTCARGRKKGGNNRIGRSIPNLIQNNVLTPLDYVNQTKKRQGRARAGDASTSTP